MPNNAEILQSLPGDTVNMVRPDTGDLHSIPKEAVQQALDAGFRLPTPDEQTSFSNDLKYGGAAGGSKAFALGALKSVPFALTGAVKSGLIDPETARQLEKYHPIADTAGQVAGTTAGFASGLSAAQAGGKLAAEGAAGALARLGLGEAVEGTGAKIAGSILARTAGSAVEGATLGAQNVINEDTIGDPSLNAESIVSQVGMGALIGGGLEGAMGLGSVALPKAVEGLRTAIGKTSDIFKLGSMGAELKDAAAGAYASASSVVSGVPKEDILSAIRGGTKINPTELTSNLNAIYKHATKAVDGALEETGVNTGILDSFNDSAVAFRKQFMYKSGSDYRVDPSKVESWLANPANTLSDKKANVLSNFTTSAKDLNAHLEDAYSNQLGEKFDNTEFNRAMFQHEHFNEEARIQDAMQRLQQSSQLAGGTGGSFGPGAIGFAAHALGVPGPLSGAIAGGYAALANPLKTVQRLARIQDIANGVSATIVKAMKALTAPSNTVTQGIKAVAIGKLDKGINQDNYNKKVAELNSGTARFLDGVDSSVSPLQAHAPNTSSALAQIAGRGQQFLSSKVPTPPRNPSQILAPKLQPSKADIAKFNRYWTAVQHPLSILKEARNGTLSKEGVEAVATVYPKLMGSIQQHALLAIAEHGNKPIAYKQRQMLSLLSGKDLDGSLNPHMVVSNQAVLMGASAKPQPQMHGQADKTRVTGLKNLDMANRINTAMQLSSRRQ